VATAANLPFADETFAVAIAYNVLMDIEVLRAVAVHFIVYLSLTRFVGATGT
jgi:hypothetical protein